MLDTRYIIQLYNYKHHHWFDYLCFYNRDNARRCFDNYKRCSDKKMRLRLIEVVAYDFKKY